MEQKGGLKWAEGLRYEQGGKGPFHLAAGKMRVGSAGIFLQNVYKETCVILSRIVHVMQGPL